MAASQTSSPELELRFKDAIHSSQDSARVQFLVTSLPLAPGSKVSVTFKQCYDVETTATPVWTILRHNVCKVIVDDLRNLSFQVALGPALLGDKPLKRTCHLMLLNRPGESTIASSTRAPEDRLPTLLCELSCGDFVFSKRVKIYACWENLVYNDAVRVFDELARRNDSEVVSRKLVVQTLRDEFDRLFDYLVGRFAAKDPDQRYASEDIPSIDDEIIDRLICLNDPSGGFHRFSDAPISKQMFCGQSADKLSGIWRSFQMLVEFVGRSTILRKIYNNRQLFLVDQSELLKIHDSACPEQSGHLFFFRIARSSVVTPALVIELFHYEKLPKGGFAVKKMVPQAYITSRQLEFARGNPLLAFAALESTHHKIFQDLVPKHFLQAPVKHVHPDGKDSLPIQEFDAGEKIDDWTGLDQDWWVSSTRDETLYR